MAKSFIVLLFTYMFLGVAPMSPPPIEEMPEKTDKKVTEFTPAEEIKFNYQEIQQTLNKNIALWKKQNIYEYKITATSYDEKASDKENAFKTINVENGNVVLTEYAKKEDREKWGNIKETSFKHVEGLFRIIQDAIDTSAESIFVSYDKKYGYPTQIIIIQNREKADSEKTYKARDLVIISTKKDE